MAHWIIIIVSSKALLYNQRQLPILVIGLRNDCKLHFTGNSQRIIFCPTEKTERNLDRSTEEEVAYQA